MTHRAQIQWELAMIEQARRGRRPGFGAVSAPTTPTPVGTDTHLVVQGASGWGLTGPGRTAFGIGAAAGALVGLGAGFATKSWLVGVGVPVAVLAGEAALFALLVRRGSAESGAMYAHVDDLRAQRAAAWLAAWLASDPATRNTTSAPCQQSGARERVECWTCPEGTAAVRDPRATTAFGAQFRCVPSAVPRPS